MKRYHQQYVTTGVVLTIIGLLDGCGNVKASPPTTQEVNSTQSTTITNQSINSVPSAQQTIPLNTTKSNIGNQSAPSIHAPRVHKLRASESFHMTSQSTGWDFTPPIEGPLGQDSILHTNNGGRSWKHVTPPQILKSQGTFAGGTAIDARHAWFSSSSLSNVSSSSRQTSVWHTSDKGKTWSSTHLSKDYMITWMRFINLQTGWLLATTGPATLQEPCKLYYTSDGGANWKELDTHGTIPIEYHKMGIAFKNAKTGWITLDDSVHPGKVKLLVTHDGGHTWSPQTVKVPARLKNQYVYATPPQFSTSKSGVLPVDVGGGKEVVLYFTNNGGSSWSPARPLPLNKVSHLSIVGNNIAWVTNGKALYATVNEGKHWVTIMKQSKSKATIIGISPQGEGTSALIFILKNGKVRRHQVTIP